MPKHFWSYAGKKKSSFTPDLSSDLLVLLAELVGVALTARLEMSGEVKIQLIAAPHRKAWLDWLSIEKRYGDNTLLAYESDLDDFCTFIGNSGTATVTRAVSRPEFRAWLADMAARGLARTTISRRVSSLRSFYRFCGQTGVADIKDMSWLKAPRPPRAVPKSVSRDDALAMLSAIFTRRGPDWSKKKGFQPVDVAVWSWPADF